MSNVVKNKNETKKTGNVIRFFSHFTWDYPLKQQAMVLTWLFKSFEFGNGSRISDGNLIILEFKYLQNKKW